jgi:hypothetical protein
MTSIQAVEGIQQQVAETKTPMINEDATRCLNYTTKSVTDEKGNERAIKIPLPFDQVIERLITISQDKLARVDTLMFCKPDTSGEEIQFLEKASDLFGRLGVLNRSVIDWTTATGAMKQTEAFSELLMRLPKYRGIETAPHYPPMPDLFYNHPSLPDADHDALADLLDRFSPETDKDRALILAMFLTALWGGGEGQRPAFILTSPDGRGSGKSTLGEMIAALLGQDYIASSTKQEMKELITRLLSPAGLMSRVVLFDNETGRVSSSELSGLITAQNVSGRRLYEGEGHRPNNLLWIITLNSPTLDSDLASRGVAVSLKRPDYAPDWRTEMLSMIDDKRWEIIAALIDLLSTKTETIDTATRWGSWENGVLAKVQHYHDDVGGLQDLIVERQRDFDDEADEVQLIRSGFIEAIEKNDVDPRIHPCFFKNSFAASIYNEATGARVRKNTALRELKNLIRAGSISELQENRRGAFGRGLLWVEDTAVGGDDLTKLIMWKENEDN